MNITRYGKIGLAGLGCWLMAGCASLEGAPRPIIPVSASVKIAANYGIQSAITKFRSADSAVRNGLTPLQYRDLVIAINLSAIDARYQEFRRNLSGEGRGGAIGIDLSIIGLTTAATLIAGSATELSAVAGAFAGGKGSVDKNLYFERTLPAILAAMDTERTKVRSHIVGNMKLTEAEYPLEVAFGDLAAYETAASIDRAIDSITADASAARKIETVALENVVKTCAKPTDLTAGRAKLSGLRGKLVSEAKVTELKEFAAIVGAKADATEAGDLGNAITEKLRSGPCTVTELDELIATIKTKPWGATL